MTQVPIPQTETVPSAELEQWACEVLPFDQLPDYDSTWERNIRRSYLVITGEGNEGVKILAFAYTGDLEDRGVNYNILFDAKDKTNEHLNREDIATHAVFAKIPNDILGKIENLASSFENLTGKELINYDNSLNLN